MDDVVQKKRRVLAAIGDKEKFSVYLGILTSYFNSKFTKTEMNFHAGKLFTPEKIKYHNQFIIALIKKLQIGKHLSHTKHSYGANRSYNCRYNIKEIIKKREKSSFKCLAKKCKKDFAQRPYRYDLAIKCSKDELALKFCNNPAVKFCSDPAVKFCGDIALKSSKEDLAIKFCQDLTMKFNEEFAMKINEDFVLKFNEDLAVEFNDLEHVMKFNDLEHVMKFNDLEHVMQFNEDLAAKFNEELATQFSEEELSMKFSEEDLQWDFAKNL